MKRGVSERVPHRWFTPKRQPWLRFCWRCGLLHLKNPATEKAIKHGCFAEDTVVEDVVKETK
jgi:hypothetical protein